MSLEETHPVRAQKARQQNLEFTKEEKLAGRHTVASLHELGIAILWGCS